MNDAPHDCEPWLDQPHGGPQPETARTSARRPARTVHFSSRSDEWPTPPWLFAALHAAFRFTLDPCATHANAQCPQHFTRAEDGLAQDWGAHTVFMNPPYGRAIRLWMHKACASAHAGATVVCLVPARTDTHWWHEYALRGEVVFLRGRLKFGGASHSAPFPSALVIFQPGLPRPAATQPRFPELAKLTAPH